MAYTVLARRYRSAGFDELVGQEPIARTLKNAIATGRVAHAYLFTGTRGVGKTSMARIFARALNAPDTIPGCPKLPGEAKNYPPKDVQQRMADAIMKGEDLNVIEIDGASNNSVDDARQLIANAGLTPTANALFKIYIIDEVHMLSPQAFNALLKTMEEPPSHVKFVLCTTEAHKVLPTIQSRCQRFDFRNIPTGKIAEHLRSVLKQEKIAVEEEVVWQVARLGNGSMRDALSLLDRITATEDRPVTMKTLVEMLGLPPRQLVRQVVEAIAAGDVPAALRSTGELLAGGISQEQLLDVLIERFRQLMLVSTCGPDSDLIEMSAEEKKEAADQAVKFDAAGLVYMIALCDAAANRGKSSSNPRAVLDAVIVRLALAEKMADVTGLLSSAPAGGEKKKVADDARPQVAPPSRLRLVEPAPATPPPTPIATAPSADPAQVWPAVLAAVESRPGLAWLRSLQLCALDAATARLAPIPGERQAVSFAVQPRNRDTIEQLLQQVTGRRIRVEIAPASDEDAPSPAAPSALAGVQRSLTREEREAAMNLPTVKELQQLFDVTLIDAKPDEESAG